MLINKRLVTTIIMTTIVFGFNACTNNQNLKVQTNNSVQNSNFKKYDNTKHIIGNKNNALTTLTYIEKSNDTLTTKIVFYIDKFPYANRFNLCTDMKENKVLSSIKTKNNHDELIFTDQPINCYGSIEVNQSSGDLIGSFDIKLLQGFHISKLKNYDIFVKETVKYKEKSTNFKNKKIHYDYLSKITKESYWIVE